MCESDAGKGMWDSDRTYPLYWGRCIASSCGLSVWCCECGEVFGKAYCNDRPSCTDDGRERGLFYQR